MQNDTNLLKDKDLENILDISTLEFSFTLLNLIYLLDCSAIQLNEEFNNICCNKCKEKDMKDEKQKILGLEIDKILFFINFNLYIMKNLTFGNTCVYLDNICS
ncbi:MAG TPA: hypothetical protein PLX16_07335, partial [Exilispira sp.]|nr:hypothetical protein [Exilispira sp.]